MTTPFAFMLLRRGFQGPWTRMERMPCRQGQGDAESGEPHCEGFIFKKLLWEIIQFRKQSVEVSAGQTFGEIEAAERSGTGRPSAPQ